MEPLYPLLTFEEVVSPEVINATEAAGGELFLIRWLTEESRTYGQVRDNVHYAPQFIRTCPAPAVLALFTTYGALAHSPPRYSDSVRRAFRRSTLAETFNAVPMWPPTQICSSRWRSD